MQREHQLTIKEYNSTCKEEWDNFVAKSNNGTIFHQIQFLEYHQKGRFEFTNYMIYNKQKLLAVLPGGYKDSGNIYWSPIGASYGSIITEDLHFELALAVVDLVIDFFKSKNVKEIFFIPPPIIYSNIYNQHLEYAMLYRKFDFEYHYISHALDLNNTTLTKLKKKTDWLIRTAKTNTSLIVKEVNDFDECYPILTENKKRHNAKPTHSLNDLKKLKTLFPNEIKQFNAYLDNKIIAGTTMFMANSQVALCFYNMLNYDYEHLSPAYLLIDYVIDWARKNKYKWFDFGVSQDTNADNPMTPALPLIFFKEHFNTRGIFRSTYHLQLNK